MDADQMAVECPRCGGVVFAPLGATSLRHFYHPWCWAAYLAEHMSQYVGYVLI